MIIADGVYYESRACLTPDRAEKRQNGRRLKEPEEPMFTLTKQDIHGVLVTHKSVHDTEIGVMYKGSWNSPSRIRRLTPRECMRLQGVSDEVTDKLYKARISRCQMYRAAGDACTVNVIYEIAKRLAIAEMEAT